MAENTLAHISKISPLSSTTSHGILATCQNLEIINDTIPRKRPNRPKDGNSEGRTDRPFFTGPFRQPLGVQIYVFYDHNLLVLPLHEKKTQKRSNTENPDGTHFVPL